LTNEANGTSPDLIVVGGGAAGCATALELAKRGLKVTLIERDAVASHASGFAYGGFFAYSGAGIPGPLLPVAKLALEYHSRLAVELKEETGIDTEYRERSSIDLAFGDEDAAQLQADAEWQREEGFEVVTLDGDELRNYEPRVTPAASGGVLHPNNYEVDSYRYTLALATAFEKHGGLIRHGEVAQVLQAEGRATAVRFSSGGELHAGGVVLATGPWSGIGEIEGAPDLPIHPLKGEIVRLNFPGTDFQNRVSAGDHYIARKPDGLLWVGSTYEDADFDERPSPKAQESILTGGLQLAPALETAEVVQHTACLRPLTADGMPVIGPIGEIQGLYCVNGAGRKGILLSPVMAVMTAALVTGHPEEAPIPPEFSSSRFG
jgi:glycine oxidase